MAAGGYGFEKVQFKTGGENGAARTTSSASPIRSSTAIERRARYVNSPAHGPLRHRPRQRPQLAHRRQFHGPTACRTTPAALTRRRRPSAIRAPRLPEQRHVPRRRVDSSRQRLGFVYTTPAGERGTITARNYYAWRDFGNLLPMQSAGIVDLERQIRRRRLQLQLRRLLARSPEPLRDGVDFDDQDDDRRRYDNLQSACRALLGFDQNEHVTSQGVFLQNELSMSKNVQLTFGVRFDTGRVRGHGPLLRRRPRRFRLEAVRRHEPDGRRHRRVSPTT